MAVLVAEAIERPRMLLDEEAEAGFRARGEVGGGPTLDDAIVGAWEGLVAQLAVACPVCGGAMRPRSASWAGADTAGGGRCGDCGASLS